ncbi:MAG: tetratricopeptide repeat protein [Enterobacterales bacterium]|nr:tetratricopeptide repeat protein [Enterobacterales bacterium]
MNDFWLAVGLSLLAALFFIWISVRAKLASDEEKEEPKSLFFIPMIVLLMAPVGYYFIGEPEQQLKWETINVQFEDLMAGRDSAIKTGNIHSLLLGLRTAIDKEPHNAKLWVMLAESYFKLRMLDQADAAMERAIRVDPNPDWYVIDAQFLAARSSEQDIAKSLRLLNKALSIEPNHQSALLTLGFVYLRQQNYRMAIMVWKQLVRIVEASGNDASKIKEQIELAETKLASNG